MQSIVNAPFGYMYLNVGSLFYGLAHEAQKSEKYKSWLTKRASEHHRDVILDNAADELGVGLAGQGLFDLANEIKPQELILPDVLQDSEQTLKNTFDFYNTFFDEVSEQSRPRFMVVAQGETLEEYLYCLKEFYAWGKYDVLGVPYDIEFDVPADGFTQAVNLETLKNFDGLSFVSPEDTRTVKRAKRRLNLIRYLQKLNLLVKPIHLLGMNNLKELKAYQYSTARNWIRSNDTTAPFAAAKTELTWSLGESGEKNWDALDFEVNWTIEQERVARRNLFFYVEACNDLRAMYQFAEVNTKLYPTIEPEWSYG